MSCSHFSKIFTTTFCLMSLFLGSSMTHAQQTTEQFIPIGMSPGISNKLSHIGYVMSVERAAKTFQMQSDNGVKTIAISSSTFIWLDRSKVSKSNIDASFGNIEAGKTVEVMPDASGENIAAWVKIESL